MSRLKIGSVTTPRSARTARGWPRAVRSPRRPTTEPPMMSAMKTREDAERPAGERRQVGDVAGFEGDARRSSARRVGTGRDRRRPMPGPRRSSAACGRLVEAIDQRAGTTRPPVRRRRGEPAGQPQVAEQDDEGDDRTPPTNRPTWAPGASRTRASKPTLRYHSASVHRSSPRLNSRKTAMAMAMNAAIPNRRPRARRGCRRRRRAAGRSPAAPAAAAASAVDGLGGDPRSSSSRPSRSSSSRVRVGRRGRRRRLVASAGVASSSGVVVPVGRRPRGVAARPAPGPRRGRWPHAAKLFHEIVEQVAHRSASLPDVGRSGPVEALRRPAGTPPARCRPARSGASSRRGPARTGTRPGPPAGRATAGSRSSGGATSPSRIWSRPASSRISPDRAPAMAGPEPGERWVGRRAGAGRDVAEADDPVVVGHPQERQPPAVGRLGRAGHAGAVACVADADLVLAQERRAGRWESVGHGRQDSRRGAPSGRRRLRRAVRPRPSVPASARRRRRAARRRPRLRRSRSSRHRRPSTAAATVASSVSTSATSAVGERPRLVGHLGDAALDDRRRHSERVGLGLEIRDLGFELEPQHLAPDGEIGRRERLRRRPRPSAPPPDSRR